MTTIMFIIVIIFFLVSPIVIITGKRLFAAGFCSAPSVSGDRRVGRMVRRRAPSTK